MDKLNKTYITMVDLELDHNDIRKEGNIIAYEMKAGIPSDNTLYQKRVNKLESHRTTLRDTCKTVQPTQSGIRQLHYRTVTT